MKAHRKSAAAMVCLVALAAVAVVVAPAAQSARKGEPRIRQMVVFSNGKALESNLSVKRTSVKIGRKTCAVAAATPLAALLRSKPGKIGFHDYGSCSKRPADSSGLFVKALRGERNRAQDGWVYKVDVPGGRPSKLATAGAADPSGPFGSGRLRDGDEVLWFYCRQFSNGSCQRSLALFADVDGRRVSAVVLGYDDSAKGKAIEGATVHVGDRTLTTGESASVTFGLEPGRYRMFASKKGTIRSFTKTVTIK